jgi:hypothetical protein
MEQFIHLINKIVIHKLVGMGWKVGREKQGLRFWSKRIKILQGLLMINNII